MTRWPLILLFVVAIAQVLGFAMRIVIRILP